METKDCMYGNRGFYFEIYINVKYRVFETDHMWYQLRASLQTAGNKFHVDCNPHLQEEVSQISLLHDLK